MIQMIELASRMGESTVAIPNLHKYVSAEFEDMTMDTLGTVAGRVGEHTEAETRCVIIIERVGGSRRRIQKSVDTR